MTAASSLTATGSSASRMVSSGKELDVMFKRAWFVAAVAFLGVLSAVRVIWAPAHGGTVTGATSRSASESRTYVAAVGRVEPAGEEIKLASPLDGILAQVLVDEGDGVRQGQVLARLENAEYQARLDR